ncbi:MAG: tetratricopeptide repeat protein [Proteobacteria bacterium]|nr:tetratricopeptide repeat protein [Pseudomonadota bacterium]
MARVSYALQATVSLFGKEVEEVFVRPGELLEVGPQGRLSMPVPQGSRYFIRVRWHTRTQLSIVDGIGRQYVLELGEEISWEHEGLLLELQLVPRYSLKRTERIPVFGAVALMVAIMAFSLLADQGSLLYKHRCEWFAVNAWTYQKLKCPILVTVAGRGIDSSQYNSDYLARLLRRDYKGADDGALKLHKTNIEKQEQSFYLPAGNEGPITDMGGAENTAPEPVRTPPTEEEQASAAKKKPEGLTGPQDVGTPAGEIPEADDGVAEVGFSENKAYNDAQAETPPAEEREGWGLPDWYDVADKAIESLEIDLMLLHARRRLAIDPNDPQALSILSYYQYLATDYTAAERTYNKQIQLFPDDSSGYNNKALIYKRRGQYRIEENLYRQALALVPEDETALNNLAVCLAHQGRFDEALAIMEQLEVIDPGDPYADLHRSKIYAEMEEIDLSLKYLDDALQGMVELDTLHHIEFRQDIRVDPSFDNLRHTYRFKSILVRYYGKDSPVQEEG